MPSDRIRPARLPRKPASRTTRPTIPNASSKVRGTRRNRNSLPLKVRLPVFLAVAPMVSTTLLADALFSLATAGRYVAVGRIVRHRGVSDRASARALGLFVLWWYSVAALSVLGAARSLAGAFGYLSLPFHVLLSYASLV